MPTSRRSPALVGTATGLLLLVGFGSLGDTPDTRDSESTIAAWFVDHRNDVFVSAVLLSLAVASLIWFVAIVARTLSEIARDVALIAGTLVAAITLTGNVMIYSSLSYVIGQESLTAAKPLFELSLLATNVVGLAVALLVIAVSSAPILPAWLRWASRTIAAAAASSILAFRHDGFLSPDVAQQVVWQSFMVWLIAVGIVVSRRQTAAVRQASAA